MGNGDRGMEFQRFDENGILPKERYPGFHLQLLVRLNHTIRGTEALVAVLVGIANKCKDKKIVKKELKKAGAKKAKVVVVK